MKAEKEEKDMPLFIPYPWSNSIQTDPQGSYTGVAEEWMENPVQDADDL